MKQNKKARTNHMLKMAFACLVPLILILILPLIGISKGLSTIIAIALMILLHFIMMKGHTDHKH